MDEGTTGVDGVNTSREVGLDGVFGDGGTPGEAGVMADAFIKERGLKGRGAPVTGAKLGPEGGGAVRLFGQVLAL